MKKNLKKWMNRRPGANKIDIEASLKKLDNDFYVYWPAPSVNLDEYKDEDGNVDIDNIPDEDVIEVVCRYVNQTEYFAITAPTTKLDFDRSKYKGQNLTEEQLKELFLDAIEKQVAQAKTEDEIAAEVVFRSIVDPQFESPEQVQEILPLEFFNTIYDEATTFVTDGALTVAMKERHENKE